jgi:DNA invertase Pin-like site-specific DNA recombinase
MLVGPPAATANLGRALINRDCFGNRLRRKRSVRADRKFRRSSVAVATSRERHRQQRSGRAGQHRRWGRGLKRGDLASQIAELQAAGCGNIFKEKASGAKTDRPELAKAIRRLEPGDVLVVTRLDRLARSTRDLLNILDELGKRGVGFRSVKDAWADTTTPHGRLMLTVLGGLAEFERELIRARTDDGRKRAQARGVRFGRPSVLTAHQRQEVAQRLAEGAVQADLARSYGVSQATISRLAAPSPFEASAAGL